MELAQPKRHMASDEWREIEIILMVVTKRRAIQDSSSHETTLVRKLKQ